MPVAQSPVDTFRKLLTLAPAEQKQFLTNYPVESQHRLLAKLREYETLAPDQRELRLRVTELRWYLLPLLNTPATNRAALLASLPANQRPQVEDRLREWDKLTSADQKELLENEATLRYFTQTQTGSDEQKQAILQNISLARREKLQAGVTNWQSLPTQQREQMLARFNQFFDLTTAEKEKALGKFSDAERQQMEKVLAKFAKLPPDQRARCIAAFDKFTAMSLEDRQQFLKNAERWRLMSSAERQQWRELVQRLPGNAPTPPPFPPGFSSPVATNTR